jgi:DNA-binding transcriptional LysR family regulator
MHLPNIDHLRSLTTVAKTGSISAASTIMNRSQSSISIQIKQLEQQMGLKLLLRHSRGVELTPEGEMVVGYADKVLSLLHEMAAISRQIPDTGTVRFGLTEEYTLGRLPAVLRQFAEMQRMVEMQLIVGETKELERKLEQGDIDLALGTTADMGRAPRTSWTTPLVWVANRQLRLDRKKPVPLLMLDRERRTWAWDVLRLLDEEGIAWREVYTTTTFASIFTAAEAGLGVTYVISECLRPSLRVIEPREGLPPLWSVEYGLFSRDDASVGAEALLHLLESALQLKPVAGVT